MKSGLSLGFLAREVFDFFDEAFAFVVPGGVTQIVFLSSVKIPVSNLLGIWPVGYNHYRITHHIRTVLDMAMKLGFILYTLFNLTDHHTS